MNRRNFLMGTGAVVGTGVVLSVLPSFPQWFSLGSNKKGVILGGGKALVQGQSLSYLSVLDLDEVQPKPKFWSLDFLPHGLDFHPRRSNVVAIFEKQGPGACEFDLSTGRIRQIKTLQDRYFYGHGAYSKDGARIFATETLLSSGEGLISVRDAQSLQTLGEFPTYGKNPHDCKLIENGQVLAITNGGGALDDPDLGCVTYVDVNSQKLLEKFEMQDARFNTGHLAIAKNDELVVVSAPRSGLSEQNPGAISIANDKHLLQVLKKPKHIIKRMQSETLSVCIHPHKDVFAATSPLGGFVSFWRLSNGEFIKSLNFDHPRGVVNSHNSRYFIISHGQEDNGIALVDVETLSVDPLLNVFDAGFSGSHLYLWS